MNDARLARRAVAGEERAFAAIFERYQQDLYRYCLAILGNSDDAQDALQNTMVKALRALPGESRLVELKPWLYRVAHNEAIDLIRRRRPAEPLDAEQLASGPDLAREAETRERLAHLIADFQTLPERQRGALVMRELSGLDFEQIGAALGTSAAVARQTVYEARLGLREIEAGREMSCDAITKALSDGDGRVLRRRDIRAHLRACPECRAFRAEIDGRSRDLAAISPLPAAAVAGLIQGVLGGGGGAGAGAAGLGAGIGGGAAKGITGATALKAAATVAAVAVIGGTAADRAHLVDLGVPGGAGSAASQSESAQPGGGAAGGQDTTSGAGAAAGLGAAAGKGTAPGVAGATPAGKEQSASPVTDSPNASTTPAAADEGQQTAAANRQKNEGKANGSARAQEARATRGPKASHPTRPAHPPKPTHPAHPAKPSPTKQTVGKDGSSATGGRGSASPKQQAAPIATGAGAKTEAAPTPGGKAPLKDVSE